MNSTTPTQGQSKTPVVTGVQTVGTGNLTNQNIPFSWSSINATKWQEMIARDLAEVARVSSQAGNDLVMVTSPTQLYSLPIQYCGLVPFVTKETLDAIPSISFEDFRIEEIAFLYQVLRTLWIHWTEVHFGCHGIKDQNEAAL